MHCCHYSDYLVISTSADVFYIYINQIAFLSDALYYCHPLLLLPEEVDEQLLRAQQQEEERVRQLQQQQKCEYEQHMRQKSEDMKRRLLQW